MKPYWKQVGFCYEYGGEGLPHLKDLVSDVEDPQKGKIIAYLDTNCVLACPGIIDDIITPGEIIGSGDTFHDGTYAWSDFFRNYVYKYNIPVPKDFRDHILQNFNSRMKRHAMLKLIDSVTILNILPNGHEYRVHISIDGKVKYSMKTDDVRSSELDIKPDNARYIIDPIMKELFCYDSDERGHQTSEGYHWKITFQRKKEIIEVVEGWPDEDPWRYRALKRILDFAERYIPEDLGANHMNVRKL